MMWFDFDRDGDVDGMDFALGGMLMGFVEDEEREAKKSALAAAGIDEFEFKMMSEDERYDALSEAGLDPDDF